MANTDIKIKKVKLRDGMFATLEYEETTDGITDEVAKMCNHPVHEDFKTRLQALAVHCVLICELVDISKVKGNLTEYSPPILNFITVKGLSANHDAGLGITLSFERILSTGRILNINTPFTKFNDENVKYKFDYQLQTDFDALIEEVNEYLSGNKYGVGKQLEMSFTAGGEDESNPL